MVSKLDSASVDADTIVQLSACGQAMIACAVLNLSHPAAELNQSVTLSSRQLIEFHWYPLFASSASAPVVGAFDSAVSVPIASLHFERVAVLYNIAAIHSILATATKRIDEAAMKSSIAGLQNAAGVLSHLLTLLPLLADEDDPEQDPMSPDFTPESIEALRDLCLAQAQEVFWQNGVLGKIKHALVSCLSCRSVSLHYSSALASANAAKTKLKETQWTGTWAFPDSLLSYMSIKAGHFNAVAQYRKSIDDLGANRYGDEIGRLEVADAAVKKALTVSKRGVADPVVRDLKSLQTVLTDNLARATKDNDLIYLSTPTPLSSLPPITPAAMARATTAAEIVSPLDHLQIGRLGKPLFEGLVPWQVHAAVKVYEDRRETFIKDEVLEKKGALDALSTRTLQELNLPAAIDAVLQPTALPASVLDQSREVKAEGGTEKLRSLMQDVRRVARVNQKLLNEAVALLSQESLEDGQLQAQYGAGAAHRVGSGEAQAALRTRADNLGGVMAAAGQSDQLVRNKFGEWETKLELLCGDEAQLDEFVPQVGASLTSGLKSTQSTTIRRLRSLIDDLHELRSARQSIIDDSRRFVDADTSVRSKIERAANDFLKKGASLSMSMFEGVFENELAKFDGLKQAMEQNGARTEDLVGHVKIAHASFVDSRRTDPALARRTQALEDLDGAYHKYREILTNLQEGLGFYNDLARLLTELRDSVKEFTQIRSHEVRHIEQELRAHMENLSMQSETKEEPVEEPRRRISPRKKTVPKATSSCPAPAAGVAELHGKAWDPSMGIRFG
ncbi:BZ3500_MvSof-1268-A1-R1_Chr1-3g01736 [Microbotryum saponariae]|uniref:BZ3500_MvSof-1268-A1-R1_Chr1-3g01736 protein n=1 Tax=Microbotryum saponariae TaxID=289078 RepID=A0A2X0L6P3_9BASI|nr:BZ3500_MvSof-1268-A1-R1_Chr1-3g01736 [Microbotryum saponariae]SCZ94471.1 BZ3501_MvSof-1269-A2-R1_Chr1-3g01338 [Microbotryum saponariae]